MSGVFISYTSQDQAWAEWIAWVLEESGHEVVLRPWDFRLEGDFILNLHMAAPEDKQHVLVVLSENYLQVQAPTSDWPDVFDERLAEADFKLLPVRVEPCRLTGALASVRSVDLFDTLEDDAEKAVLKALNTSDANGQERPTRIFLSYRRSDSADIAGRMYDRLASEFGESSVFFDLETIPIGADIREYLAKEVQKCQVMLAVISPDWLTAQDDDRRRIDNSQDWVRLEIETALSNNVPVIPILVNGARMPRHNELPNHLQSLASRNAALLHHGSDFEEDIQRLVEAIKRILEQPNEVAEDSSVPGFRRHKQQETVYGFVEKLSDNLDLEMMQIPAGTFLMGSPEDELERDEQEGPQHPVNVPEFFMGKYPVTQAQWRFVAELPQIERDLKPDPSHFKGERHPVEKVSWFKAVEFCQRLSQFTGRNYRLPSEAEWEYACRAGTATPFHFGETITTEVANYRATDDEQMGWKGNYGAGPKGKYRKTTTPVDHFSIANAFGLCDMHGNVREWCQDHFHDSYKGAPTDGSAWVDERADKNVARILRGGSWDLNPWYCRSAYRYIYFPRLSFNAFGFRVVCSAPRALP